MRLPISVLLTCLALMAPLAVPSGAAAMHPCDAAESAPDSPDPCQHDHGQVPVVGAGGEPAPDGEPAVGSDDLGGATILPAPEPGPITEVAPDEPAHDLPLEVEPAEPMPDHLADPCPAKEQAPIDRCTRASDVVVVEPAAHTVTLSGLVALVRGWFE